MGKDSKRTRSQEHKSGFTLPEVLIVIGIIGVVSALIMPTVIREFEMRSNSYREANIANKVTQAMELMNAAGDLHYYQTTADFNLSSNCIISLLCFFLSENLICYSSYCIACNTKQRNFQC